MPAPLLLLPLLGGGAALAACPTASPDRTVCAGPCTDTTIAGALGNAADGDTICVASGTYSEKLSLSTNKQVRIEGDSGGVTLDTGAGNEIVQVSGGGDLALVGIDVAGGGGRRCLDVSGAGSTLLLDGVSVTGCTKDVAGSAVYVHQSATLAVQGGSRFASNHDNSYSGGAVSADTGATLSVADTTFDTNYADSGGAVMLTDATGTFTRATFTGNQAKAGNGGAIRATGTSTLTVDECTFTNDSSPPASGGGVSFEASGTLTLGDSTFTQCAVHSGGGGPGRGGALFVDATGPITVVRNGFLDGNADYGGGLAVLAAGASSVVANNVFELNYCDDAGGGAWVAASLQVRNNVFAANDCKQNGSDGDAIFVNGGTVDFRDNVLAYQPNEGIDRALGSVTSDYNDWYQNIRDVTGVTKGSNELNNTDPVFLQFTNDGVLNDLFLPGAGSPLVDRGDPAITDIDGSRSDIGLSGGPFAPDQDGDGSFRPLDCDDDDPDAYPGAPEVGADGIDQDCDGVDACFEDLDGDGYGGPTLTPGSFFCTAPGEIAVSDDCDDTTRGIHPGAAEVVADGIDQDCDGADACYLDQDDDGYGSSTLVPETDGSCTDDSFQAPNAGDCDDTDAQRSPGLLEIAVNGVDNDCDGYEDCYLDNDRDGHGGTNLDPSATLDCSDAGHSNLSDDCADNDAQRFPGNTEIPGDGKDESCDGQELCYRDLDHDGHGTSVTVVSPNLSCADNAESSVSDDCNDAQGTIHPGAVEVTGDGTDQDCDGHDQCFQDGDGDGAAGISVGRSAGATCSAAAGEYTTSTDCADTDPNTYPGAPELVDDGTDEDCDTREACYQDLDHDGYGTSTLVSSADLDCLDTALNEARNDTDCDDARAAIHPGVAEVTGNDTDENCDGLWSCWQDGDHDGHGSTTAAVTDQGSCTVTGFSLTSDDCDDTRAAVHPGGTELPDDGIDQDCSGTDTVSCVTDGDQDGYGTDDPLAPPIFASDGFCDQTQGEADAADDCDDALAGIHPGAQEIRNNGIDEDCDGNDLVDCYIDADNDGYGESASNQSQYSGDCGPAPFLADRVGDCDGGDVNVHPGAADPCGDGVDSDCGQVGQPVDEDRDGLPYDDEVAAGSSDCLEDSDGDGIRDAAEVARNTDPANVDSDGDSVSDGVEWGSPLGAPPDTDGDGTIDPLDTDDDDDLVPTLTEMSLPLADFDNDGLDNRIDPDDDGDTLLTAAEDVDGDGDPTRDDTDVDGTPNWLDPDDDGDGIPTGEELAVLADPLDRDSDHDGIPDSFEWPDPLARPPDRDLCMDDLTTTVTACPDGIPDIVDTDDDGDDIPTAVEGAGDFDRDGTPDYLDPDTDGDRKSDLGEGVGDEDDDGSPNYKDPDDHDGPTGDPDFDGLSTNDERAVCLPAPLASTCLDPNDPDTNDDLVLDGDEAPGATQVDTDGDGTPDWADDDDDDDGYPSEVEVGFTCDDGTLPTLGYDTAGLLLDCADGSAPTFGPYRDTDEDGTPDYLDPDDDGDGVLTVDEDPAGDHDGDGVADPFDADPEDGPLGDLDGDGLTNTDEDALGTWPWSEDTDADGVPDGVEAQQDDSDGDGTVDALDDDDDDDGIPTIEEGQGDTDGDGTPDYLDTDSDGDGTRDADEADGDGDCDGLPDVLDARDDALCDASGAQGGAMSYTRQGCGGCDAAGTAGAPWIALGALGVLIRRRRRGGRA